jgi:hypothetical protein
VITREQAERIAAEILGTASDATDREWELVEFDSGWLIKEQVPGDEARRGGAARVVERASGRVVRFPSSVPPGRILSEYDSVADRGRIEKDAQ